MKNKQFIVSVLIAFLASILCSQCDSRKEALFEQNERNWITGGDADWQFESNVLVGSVTNGPGFVMTENEYSDFILELEFKPDSTVNSGIFIRCKNRELSNRDCYEINIWDLHPDQKNRTGTVVTRTTPITHIKTLNKWNTYKIRSEKNRLQVWINRILTADLINGELVKGPIALQAAESGEIRFRNVKIEVLNKDN